MNKKKINTYGALKIGPVPHWISKWGWIMFFILLSLIIGGGFCIRFPDIVPAKVMITTANPPVKIVSRSAGLLGYIKVQDNQLVDTGEVISVLVNAASYEDVQKVISIVRNVDSANFFSKQISRLTIPSGLQLGELQTYYTDFFQALEQYQFFISKNNYHTKIDHLQKQVEFQAALSQSFKQKRELLKERSQLQYSRYLTDSALIVSKVISGLEFEEARNRIIDNQLSETSNDADLLQSLIDVMEYKKNIVEQYTLLQNEENNLQVKLKHAAKQFQGSYSQWEQKYVLKSPIAGKVSFFKFWKENQFVNNGESVFMVTPLTQDFIVRGSMGINRAGKIKKNQKVMIKLTAYPFEEFGTLQGHIQGQTQVYLEDSFYLDIILDKGLQTNSGKYIPPQYLLEGRGEIITNNKSVFQRLLETLTLSMEK